MAQFWAVGDTTSGTRIYSTAVFKRPLDAPCFFTLLSKFMPRHSRGEGWQLGVNSRSFTIFALGLLASLTRRESEYTAALPRQEGGGPSLVTVP